MEQRDESVELSQTKHNCQQTMPTPQAEVFSKAVWKSMGFRVPTKAKPYKRELYLVPGFSTVYRTRYLYARDQVIPIDREQFKRRSTAAQQAAITRSQNTVKRMEEVEITIISGYSYAQVWELALDTHGKNYLGNPGEFNWCDRTARNAIRHNLTNYEKLLKRCNNSDEGRLAYLVLRGRIDILVDETYPEYAEHLDNDGREEEVDSPGVSRTT